MILDINYILVAIASLLISCKKDDSSSALQNHNRITESLKQKESAVFSKWYFSSLNHNKSYEDFILEISKDSIKITKENKLICKGEIVVEKSNFKKYFRSEKTANEIKQKLQNEYNVQFGNDISVISNVYGDLAKEGCLFPFGELFIIDNHLFFYDKEYFLFTLTLEKNYQLRNSNLQLPYNAKIDVNNVKYETVNKNIIKGIEDFSCGDQLVRYISLPKINNLDLILIPMDCGDFPYRFYLITIKDNKIISNIYVEGEWSEPETYGNFEKTNFSIDENEIIHVTTKVIIDNKIQSENSKMYKVNENGTFRDIQI
ncbi:hypothetical protein [Flavobacterium hercynium]|uniref:hypothetical protein n=1 Tax=Flavobacterium hercynium TaxID=387094 RepID=UPI000B5B9DA2|nr:hypothetical protein [Flavobacterium hercynium]SMP12274.1 hypothetical protein SAMN06265346_103231 [Flavobacterium hercynium]